MVKPLGGEPHYLRVTCICSYSMLQYDKIPAMPMWHDVATFLLIYKSPKWNMDWKASICNQVLLSMSFFDIGQVIECTQAAG